MYWGDHFPPFIKPQMRESSAIIFLKHLLSFAYKYDSYRRKDKLFLIKITVLNLNRASNTDQFTLKQKNEIEWYPNVMLSNISDLERNECVSQIPHMCRLWAYSCVQAYRTLWRKFRRDYCQHSVTYTEQRIVFCTWLHTSQCVSAQPQRHRALFCKRL